MSYQDPIHLHFSKQNVNYEVTLTPTDKTTAKAVQVGGNSYTIEAKNEAIQALFDSIGQDPIQSKNDLKIRLGVDTTKAVDGLKQELEPLVPEGAAAMVVLSANGEKPKTLLMGTALNEQTVALLGSGAKMFTGLTSKILEEKGILSMQTRLGDCMEERHFALFAEPEKAKNITLGMLLSHTSGLQYAGFNIDNRREGKSWDVILDDMLREKSQDPIQFTSEVGDGVFSYSNLISFASIIIEKCYNKDTPEKPLTYSEIVKEVLLDPLEMGNTTYVKPQENVLNPFDDGGDDVRDPTLFPAGGVWSNPEDMTKLAVAFRKAFTTGEGLKNLDGTDTLITKGQLEDLLQPRGMNAKSGLGMDIQKTLVGKGGNFSAFDFKFKIDRETGSFIVSFANFTHHDSFPKYILHIVPTLLDLQGAAKTSPSVNPIAVSGEPLSKCIDFYRGEMGWIGTPGGGDLTWVNWNGEILPLKNLEENTYRVAPPSRYEGRTIKLASGKKSKSRYLFIEYNKHDEQVIQSGAFQKVEQDDLALQKLKKQQEFSLRDIMDATATYRSTRENDKTPDMTLTVNAQKGVTLSHRGNTVQMNVVDSQTDAEGNLLSVTLVGNFFDPPLYQLRLNKSTENQWTLECFNFITGDVPDILT